MKHSEESCVTLKENYKDIYYNITSPRHSKERLQHNSWVGIGRELKSDSSKEAVEVCARLVCCCAEEAEWGCCWGGPNMKYTLKYEGSDTCVALFSYVKGA